MLSSCKAFNQLLFRFKENYKYFFKNVPTDKKRLLLDLNLLPLDLVKDDPNKILKFEEGYLIDRDVKQSNEKRRRSSVAYCARPALIEDAKPGKNAVDLEICCPKCRAEDCSWLCYRCLSQLRYDPETVQFCCDCGGASVNAFEFKCKDYRLHNEEYVKFAPDRLKMLLEKLSSFKQTNMLVSANARLSF